MLTFINWKVKMKSNKVGYVGRFDFWNLGFLFGYLRFLYKLIFLQFWIFLYFFWNLEFELWSYEKNMKDWGRKWINDEGVEEEDEEIKTKICWWWCTVRSGGHAKSNDCFYYKKIQRLRLKNILRYIVDHLQCWST
jgi:hypothetical protein